MKKALALIALLAILIFAGLVLINSFYPNPYTSTLYLWLTVSLPAYLGDKLEWVFGSISAVMAVIGAASKKIGKVRDEATEKVSAAESKTAQAQALAVEKSGDVQTTLEENERLKNELKGMKQTRTEAEHLLSQRNEEIKRLQREKTELLERLENKPVKIVEVVK